VDHGCRDPRTGIGEMDGGIWPMVALQELCFDRNLMLLGLSLLLDGLNGIGQNVDHHLT